MHDIEHSHSPAILIHQVIIQCVHSGFGYQLLEFREDGILKGGITSVTKTESLIETAVNDSIEEYYTDSWDQGRYGEHCYEDAIPSWRKTYLPEVARPATLSNGYEESMADVQSVVTNRQRDWNKFDDMGVRSSSRDPGNAWNLGQYGDLSHEDRIRWDMAYFEGDEKVGEKYDYQESLNGFHDFEMTTEIHSASILEINSPAASIRSFKNEPDTSVERKAFLNSKSSEEKEPRHFESCSTMTGTTATEVMQRDSHTLENKCQGRVASPCTPEHEDEDLDLNQGKSFLKEDHATSMDDEEQSQASAYGFTTSATIQTSMDISSVKDNSFKKDSRSSGDPEKHRMKSPTSLELTEDGMKHGDNGDLLTVRDIPVASHTEVENEHVEKQGAESQWSLYLGEPEESTKDNSETEENLSQDSLSCKCISSLKYDLGSLEESTQSRDEMLVNNSCEPRMDLHPKGDETIDDSTTEITENPTIVPEIDDSQPLNSARSVSSRSCEYVKLKEKIKDNQDYSQNEIDSKPVEKDKTRQTTQADEAHDQPLAVDITALTPDLKHSEGTATKHSSIGDSNIAQDPDKDLNQLMRSLGLTNDEPKKCLHEKEEEPLNEKAFSLSRVNSQKEESRRLGHEKRVPASGKMSGLPEIGEMLFNQEMQAAGKAQKSLQDHLLQDSTAEAQNPEVSSNSEVNLESSQASKLLVYDTHALESLRTSIVIRKQEPPVDKEIDKDTVKESLDWMSSHKNHPILALAIRNNQLVKLESQEDFQKEEKPTLSPKPIQVDMIIHSKLAHDENSKETARFVHEGPDIHASEPTHTVASQEENHSSSEESIYKGDSFEEEEEDDEGDQKPTYSEESCTNEDTRVSAEEVPDSLGPETDEQSSPGSKPNVEGDESGHLGKPSENWEGASEQGSYSPDEDATVADPAEWLDTCGSQGTTNAHGGHSIS